MGLNMKVTFLSDTHMRHREIELPGGNILVYAGDCMSTGYIRNQLTSFIDWFAEQNYTHKVCIAGNHDRWCEDHDSETKEMFKEKGIIYLKDELVEIEGLRIYGTPYQPYFCNWAFNIKKFETLKDIFKMIPEGLDILITHCPPFGILDKSHLPRLYYGYTGEESLGSVELKEVLEEMIVKPNVCVFGHIHGDGGKVVEEDGIKYINASVCNEDYEPVNEIITMEIEKGEE